MRGRRAGALLAVGTALLVGACTPGAFSTITTSGLYEQAGKTVTVTFSVTITTVGTASSSVLISVPVAPNTTILATGVGYQTTTGKSPTVVGASPMVVALYDNTSAIAAGTTLRGTLTYGAA